MAWDLACLDWKRRIASGQSLIPSMPLDLVQAERAVGIYNKLRLPDVPGQPSFGEAGGEWFRDIIRALFGSVLPSGEREIQELFNLVPKKNSKTTNSAALMMTALLLNTRPRAEFLLIGPTKAVADLAFSQAVGMIEADPEGFLQKRMHVRDNVKEIQDRRTKAILKVKSFDTSVMTGVKPVGALVDELHEIAANPHASRVIGQIRGGLLANPEGFLVFITTQSEKQPAGVFEAELEKARGIRDGLLTGIPMLPVLYEFPDAMMRGGEEAPWRDSKNWWMVTPNLGRPVTIERLEREWKAAQAGGAQEMVRWASQHLNVQIGVALGSKAWAGAKYWQRAEEPAFGLVDLLARCDVVTAGIDGGGLDDFLALAVIGREIGTRRWLLWVRAWAHVDVKELRKSEASRFEDFEADGDLIFVEDLAEANTQLAGLVATIEASGLLNKVGIDMYGCTDALDALAQEDIAGDDKIAGISQGWKLNGIIKAMEVRLSNRTLLHAGQRMMAWCIGNAKVVQVGNAISITKQAAGTDKIDPLVAAFCAGTLMNANPEASGTITQGFVVL